MLVDLVEMLSGRRLHDLAKHFTDEEIIELGLFCAETDGVGKFVKSSNVVSWEEACELDPKLAKVAARKGKGAAA